MHQQRAAPTAGGIHADLIRTDLLIVSYTTKRYITSVRPVRNMNLYPRGKQWATAANCSPRPTGTEASVPTFFK